MHVGIVDIADITKIFYHKHVDLADIADITKTFYYKHMDLADIADTTNGCKALVVSAILAKSTCMLVIAKRFH